MVPPLALAATLWWSPRIHALVNATSLGRLMEYPHAVDLLLPLSPSRVG
jgi:hypothetical protein